MRAVGPGEISPVQPHTHGANESRRDHINQRVGQFSWERTFFPYGDRRVPFTVRSQRKVVGHARGLDAWQRAHAGEICWKITPRLASLASRDGALSS